MPEPQVHQIPTIIWLLTSGGLAPLLMGLLLAAAGGVFAFWPSRRAGTVLLLASFLPLITGMILVYQAAVDYSDLAVASSLPKPSAFAKLTGQAMGSSFGSLVGSACALLAGIVVLVRADAVSRRSTTSHSSTSRNG